VNAAIRDATLTQCEGGANLPTPIQRIHQRYFARGRVNRQSSLGSSCELDGNLLELLPVSELGDS
jgi:hypothetical protein